jgi:transposase
LGSKTKFSIDLGLDHVKVKRVERNGDGTYHIFVSCSATSTKCYKCGKIIHKFHGQCKETIIEHMPIWDDKVFIHVQWPRFICTDCDNTPTTSFHPDWLNQTGDMTKLFEKFCLRALINSTIKDTAIKLKTTEEKIQGVVDRNVSTEIVWDEIMPTRIGIDEVALRKGHDHYLTIISDISKKGKSNILAVIDGRKREDVIPILRKIPRHIFLNLESICVDMGASFLSAVKEVVNDIKIFERIVTVDRFHVAKLLGEAIDDERKFISRELKKKYADDDATLESIKETMWPFRHHTDDITNEQHEKLDSLFSLSPYLQECYELKEELYLIFEGLYSKDEARMQIQNWCNRALECQRDNESPFSSFVATYNRFEENILNYFETRASSGPVEGLNNKIKTIKRRGFGFSNVIQFAQRLFLDINLKWELLPNAY